MYTAFDNRRAVITAEGTVQQDKTMSPRYRTVDPQLIGNKLAVAGFHVHHIPSRSPFTSFLEVTYPNGSISDQTGDKFKTVARAIFDHSGRRAVQICPGALRMACENQFYNPAICIRHDNEEIDHFLDDPAEVLNSLRGYGEFQVKQLDQCRGIGSADTIHNYLESRPRLQKRFYNSCSRYPDGSLDAKVPFTLWSAFQGLTDTRSPALIKLASEGLQPKNITKLAAGELPESWTTAN